MNSRLNNHGPQSRGRKLALGAAGTLLFSGLVAAPTLAAEPPQVGHQVISFPQRDFVSATGYVAGVDAYVEIIRGGVPIAISTPVQPQGAEGLVEVNHPGGGCWSTAKGTPDIQPGDKVRVFQEQDDPSTPGVVDPISIADDTTTTANVTAGAPVVSGLNVTVKGTAATATGGQIPLSQIEQRFISKKVQFTYNGRRDLRAPRDGRIAYDSPTSTSWTATYTLKSTADVPTVQSSESRAIWLGANPGNANESTIYENGAVGGPAAPCTAPLQGAPAPLPPKAPTAAPAATSVTAPVAPHSLIAFPSRDFISADGYTPGSSVSFSVLRPDGTLIGQSDPITVDPSGLAEVNHPGGGCFTAGTQTPDIKPGDVVRINLGGGVAEQTTVANVTVGKATGSTAAGTIRVTGRAVNADGTAMDLGQVEQRFVNPARFSNGSRTLRAPGQGTLVPDTTAGAPVGSFVATYQLAPNSPDVAKALGGETRALWLGPATAPATQLTIFELPDTASGVLNGVIGGPTPPCTASAQVVG